MCLPGEAGYESNGCWVNHEMENTCYFGSWYIERECWGLGAGSSMLYRKRCQEPFFVQARHTSIYELVKLTVEAALSKYGQALIKQVFIDGKPYAEVMRAATK